MLALPARAKLNLDLEVTRRRDDGFHEVRTTLQEIDLHDLLEISVSKNTFLTTSGLSVTNDDQNSVLKAQQALEHAARRGLPASFHLHKRIPPGSGLGGASSDAAAALKALAALYKLDLDLKPVAQELGADVPFFLAGGRAKGEGRGDRISPLPGQHGWFAIAWPGIELSTADVYRAWDDVEGDGPNELRRAAEHVEPRLREFAASLGEGWQMTGSGSAFFVHCSSRDGAVRLTTGRDCWTAIASAVGVGS